MQESFCGWTLNAQLVIRMVEACAINLFIQTLKIIFWTTKIMNQGILSPSKQHKSASILERIRESQRRRTILNTSVNSIHFYLNSYNKCKLNSM